MASSAIRKSSELRLSSSGISEPSKAIGILPQALARRLKTVVEAVRGGDKAPLKQRLKPWKDFDDRLWLRFEPTWDVAKLVDDAQEQMSPR